MVRGDPVQMPIFAGLLRLSYPPNSPDPGVELVKLFTTATLALALGVGMLVTGQAHAQKDLVAKKEAKLKKEFFTKAPWFTDYDKARAEAKKSKKVIFTYFTRSYSP